MKFIKKGVAGMIRIGNIRQFLVKAIDLRLVQQLYIRQITKFIKKGNLLVTQTVLFPFTRSRRLFKMVRHRFVVHGQIRYLRSEEHTSELQSLMLISYAVF